ncbi:MAG: signal recognition particle-docking protein FtsY [Proteobacteria bacterium]|nr:signal recognition particle-docking protein FtsY [Pseudomonadota bacterium]
MNFFSKIKESLSKTHDRLVIGFNQIFSRNTIDDQGWEELENLLITSDIGYKTTEEIITELKKRNIKNLTELQTNLIVLITNILKRFEGTININPPYPYCILVVGVNGVGKTTTIAKLGRFFQNQGKKVVFGAGDTFRAAAIEQLEIWGNRLKIDVVKQREGADPAAVAYDSLKYAQSKNADVLIIDTAGRLHTKSNLMEELRKIKRVINRENPSYPQETLLILDATVGQNALSQTKTFKELIDISGIIMTKLDGTAKGGILINVSREFDIPIKFIGTGEKIDDLEYFNAQEFAEGLFK